MSSPSLFFQKINSLMVIHIMPQRWVWSFSFEGVFGGGMFKLWCWYIENLPIWVDLERLVTWHKISYVIVGKTNEGWDKKVWRVEHCETKPRKLIEYFKHKLKDFVIHNFMSKWKEKAFRTYVPNVPPNMVVYLVLTS